MPASVDVWDEPAHFHGYLTRREKTVLKKFAADEGTSMCAIISRFIRRDIMPLYPDNRGQSTAELGRRMKSKAAAR
jgi:hypothetical protein